MTYRNNEGRYSTEMKEALAQSEDMEARNAAAWVAEKYSRKSAAFLQAMSGHLSTISSERLEQEDRKAEASERKPRKPQRETEDDDSGRQAFEDAMFGTRR